MSEAFICDAVRTPIGRYGGSLAGTRGLGLPDDAVHVNANGGAIALGHPPGMSGARIAMTAVHQLERTRGRRALIPLCIAVGMGLALAIERS